MNEWIRKSIKIANSKRYLDKLSKIYEMKINPERPLPKNIIPELKKAFESKNAKKLIKLLIDHAAVFPVKDSYIGFLRANPQAMKENPKTTQRIAKRLYSLGFERMMQEASRPKETNRQLGNAFKRWVPKLGHELVNEEDFLAIDNRALILKGSDKLLAKFAKEKLKCKLRKGIDFVIKKKGVYIIGEAKFLTTPGGEQDRGFDDALAFINEKSGNAIRIAILDGYIWLKSNKGLNEKIRQSEDNIMSALLLRDFIESL
jgi:hypothetical protein